jgi:hypothetical protein
MRQSSMSAILSADGEPHLIPFVRFALDTIAAMPPRERPWGVWFARHAPVPPGYVHHLNTPVTDIWFFDGHAVRRRDLWAYARFFTVHQVQPWCGLRDGEPYDVRGIGSVRFAARQGHADRAYMEDIWRMYGNCHIRAYELMWDAAYATTEHRLLWEGNTIIITHLQRHF